MLSDSCLTFIHNLTESLLAVRRARIRLARCCCGCCRSRFFSNTAAITFKDWGPAFITSRTLLVDSFGLTWIHLHSLGLTWTHMDSLGFTWIQLDLLRFSWTHLDSLGLTWIHIDSLGFTCTHLHLLGLTRIHSDLTREKGKSSGAKPCHKGSGKGRDERFHWNIFWPATPRVRTHERNESICRKRFRPPTPNLRCISYRYPICILWDT